MEIKFCFYPKTGAQSVGLSLCLHISRMGRGMVNPRYNYIDGKIIPNFYGSAQRYEKILKKFKIRTY